MERLLLSVLALCFTVIPARPALHAQPSPFAGTWQGKLTLDGVDHGVTIQVIVHDSTVTGSFSDDCWVVREHACVEDGSSRIRQARIVGDTLTFLVNSLEFAGAIDATSTLPRMRVMLFNPYDGGKSAFVVIKQQRASP